MEVIFPEGEPPDCVVIGRKVPNMSYAMPDQVILEYHRPDSSTGKIKNAVEGVVTFSNHASKGEHISPGTVVAKITDCDHAIVIKDLCGSCGKDLRTKEGAAGQRAEVTSASVSMIHHVPELIVSNELAKQLGTADQQHVLKARKLVLLVDLDQTIIHTTNRPHGSDIEGKNDITQYSLYGGVHYTKIRPYTKDFLENMSRLYEMHIVTYGQRQYAHRIAEIIDPDKKFFGHRIMSRDELFSQHHKTLNLKALFPCGDQLIAIIDDRADVWQYSEALVQVKPYRYFKEVGDINAAACGHANEPVADLAVNDDDHVLEHVERVLTDVHQAFYKHYDTKGEIKDLKVIISYLKSQVLRGLHIVLSGVVPLGIKDPRQSVVYRLCVQFGAKVMESVTPETTHVIAARWGTQKVHQAAKLGKYVVTPAWLYACVEKWLKADEKDFELTKDTIVPESGHESGRHLIKELSDLPIVGKGDMKNMCDEVDEALGDDDDDDEEDDPETGGGETTGDDTTRDGTEEEGAGSSKVTENKTRKRCPEAEDNVSDADLTDGGESVELANEGGAGRKKRRLTLEEEDDGDEDDVSDVDYGDDTDDDKEAQNTTGGAGDTDDDVAYDEEEDADLDDMAADIENQLDGM